MKTNELVDRVERDFDCEVGDQMASHHFPDAKTCHPYVVYAAASRDEGSLTEWLLINVFDKLRDAGAKKLYWRSDEKIEHRTVIPLSEDESKEWGFPFRPNSTNRIWTRLLALGCDGEPIRITSEIKIEGEIMKELGHEE